MIEQVEEKNGFKKCMSDVQLLWFHCWLTFAICHITQHLYLQTKFMATPPPALNVCRWNLETELPDHC